MRLRFRPPESRPEAAPPGGHGPHLLRDGALLASWYIQHRLEEEVQRARRYGRPLAVMQASPVLRPDEALSPAVVENAAEAAMNAARTTDLVGWADEGRRDILIILPETIADIARVAAARWRDEMWLHGRRVDGPKWDIALLHDLDEFTSRELIDAALQQRLEAERIRAQRRAQYEDEEDVA
ncbi:MAG TPA: hypothetical protein VFC53_03050 [Dehalococcoidia bacterium]|jgi:hypothetical protein|nr:hypothetical protein [Dehalococcoidia bacterium]